MRYAIHLPIISEYSDPRLLSELAHEAEAAGWAGVFVWESLPLNPDHVPAVTDPWIALAAIALRTSHIKIGPLAIALDHRRPWKVAREIVALDQLSGGRLILGVGLDQSGPTDSAQLGVADEAQARASKLDEVLEIVSGLCSGEPFGYDGEHYQLQEIVFLPRPVQQRIPIWAAVDQADAASLRRAARWDGAYYLAEADAPDSTIARPASPDGVRTMLEHIDGQRARTAPYDLVISRSLWQEDAATAQEAVAALAAAGATWIVQDVLPWELTPDQARMLIRRGPPKA
ncbi:MAG TPA: LLM class flavin-dependent oxidoreductase [Herpetosiphonaceae bacterium]